MRRTLGWALLAMLAGACGRDADPPDGGAAVPDGGAAFPDGGADACPGVTAFAEGERGPFLVAAGATRLYWTTAEGVRAAPLAGGPADTLIRLANVRTLAVAGDDAFVGDRDGFVIRRLPADGGPAEVVAAGNPETLVVFGEHLYWTQRSADNHITGGAREGRIARVPLRGGAAEVVVDRLETPRHLAVNGSATSSRRRPPTTASSPTSPPSRRSASTRSTTSPSAGRSCSSSSPRPRRSPSRRAAITPGTASTPPTATRTCRSTSPTSPTSGAWCCGCAGATTSSA